MSTGVTQFDFSSQGRTRVYVLTVVGTLFCIAVTLGIDSFSWKSMKWGWGESATNDVMIPLLLAPPFFWFLLSKLRELAIAHTELMSVAATDGLTQVLNRRAFTAVVEGYLDRLDKQGLLGQGAMLVIDVDHFKSVNDAFGHDMGDEALKLIAQSIQQAVRENDIVGRIGGEEFGVFLPEVTLDLTQSLSERIRQKIHQSGFAPNGLDHPLTISVGGVAFARKTSFSELYRAADERLYAAKRSGRDRVNVFDIGVAATPALM